MARIRYNQKGYSGCSMSTRAVIAYESGEKPKSKWTKRAMLDAIEEFCDECGIDCDGKFAGLTKAQLFDQFFEWKSWHHTGKYATRTDFYGVDYDKVLEVVQRARTITSMPSRTKPASHARNAGTPATSTHRR